MKQQLFLFVLIVFFALMPEVKAQDKVGKNGQETEKSTPIQIRNIDDAYQMYIDFANGYLQCNSMEEVQIHTQNNMERLQLINQYIQDYSSNLTPEQLEGLQDIAQKLSAKMQDLAGDNPSAYTGDDNDSIEELSDENPEAANKAIQDYIDLMNELLACNSYDEYVKYVTENNERMTSLVREFSNYASYITPEQTEIFQKLAQGFSEKSQTVWANNPQESSGMQDVEEDMSEENSQRADEYLDCLEDKIVNSLLPTNSLFYLNRYYLESVKDTCGFSVLVSYYNIEGYHMNEQQRARLNDLMNMVEANYNYVVKWNQFDTSPDAVIAELNNHFDKMVANMPDTSELESHGYYIEILSKFMVDKDQGTSKLTAKQKDDFLTVMFRFARMENQMKLKEEVLTQSFQFETLDELLILADSFYNDKLIHIDSADELNEKDRKYFREMRFFLLVLTDSDFMYFFIEDTKVDKIRFLAQEYENRS